MPSKATDPGEKPFRRPGIWFFGRAQKFGGGNLVGRFAASFAGSSDKGLRAEAATD